MTSASQACWSLPFSLAVRIYEYRNAARCLPRSEPAWAVVADALRDKQLKLAAMMDASRDDVLAYMDFPREHWTQIASTNPLERVNREIKLRAYVVGVRAFLRTDGSHALTPQ